jgi:hypothetical protein
MEYNTVKEFIYANYDNENTADSYWSSIKVFIERYDNIDDDEDIDDFEIICNEFYINDHYDTYFENKEISTKQKFISSLNSVLLKLYDYDNSLIEKKLLDEVNFKFKTISEICTKNQQTKKNDIDFTLKDIYDIFEKTKKNTPEYIYLASILFIPPRRLDWEFAFYIREDDYNRITDFKTFDYNYVIINNDKTVTLSFHHKFKNLKALGFYKQKLINSEYTYFDKVKDCTYMSPKQFGDILIDFYNENLGRRFVLTDKFKGFGKKQFSNWVKRHPLKTLKTCQTKIRNCWISSVLNNVGIYMNTAEKLAFAKDMGQKTLTIQDTYREVLTKEEDSDTESEMSEESIDEINNVEIHTKEIAIQTESKNIYNIDNIENNIIENIKLLKIQLKEKEEELIKLKEFKNMFSKYN